ncbi:MULTISPECIES: FadR/GntR family transcriptional regulator [Rhodococcus]|jgi:GntR family transcriptional repressor for pyruvate dehydrogenase complex|uniref:DNA-binding FadR family transcriptional regulator n=1 Tax=Nocardia globerula TaxID=1818 RepID=A0A652YRB3_NOCGL|nr:MULTISPECIES: FCD domain-containing protein [Rhodococcus]NMD63563.1 FadR family transcriptional regulator [Nocardia globerula]MCE4267028.1 FadR family transcriptional regulator [Rhodococcus globerulus]MDV8065032.1 FCD domain-containing protein [Rhodococcus sp. IEGM 1366]PVX63128.1 DNA-binding FadR family transcriptional regulator [Rhodococcus globerulus]QXW00078.1 FCD domain-containing protein [Rhodococcus globerulus]
MPSDSSPRAWEQVLTHLEKRLTSGEVVPGQRLPGERILAAELGVGRSSVREALRVMEALGLLKAQTGSGPTSGAMIVARPTGGMTMLMRMQVAAQGFPVTDVVKTRLVLEAEVMQELARTQPTPDLGAAVELLDSMDNLDLSAHEFLILDAQFHVALADAAGNQVVAAMMTGLRESIEAYVLSGVNLECWPTTCCRLRNEHRGIVDAVQAGDPELARERITGHIRGYYAESTHTGA